MYVLLCFLAAALMYGVLSVMNEGADNGKNV